MDQMKVTIIVPVHNSTAYLKKCVDSCLNQTLSEIEIILVDDASTDESPAMIAEYASKYPHKIIPIYLTENLRQGGARNRGIEAARGEYLCFVDSDDWIEPEMCAELYQAAKAQDADMAGGNCFVSTDTEDVPKNLGYVTAELGVEHWDNLNFYLSCQGIFWNRIYRRKNLLEKNIRFPEKVFYEDSYFNFMTALYANRVVKIEKCYYHYYQRPNSTVRVRNHPRAYDKIAIAEYIAKDTRDKGVYQDYQHIVDNKVITTLASCILYGCLSSFDQPDKSKLALIRDCLISFCPDYKKNPYYASIPSDLKFYLNLTVYSPALTIWCYKWNVYSMLVRIKGITKKIWKSFFVLSKLSNRE